MSKEQPKKTKDCSACGEEILWVALKCKFCGVVLEKEAFGRLKHRANPPPGLLKRKVSGLGVMLGWIGTLGCIVGGLALVLAYAAIAFLLNVNVLRP